MSRMQKSLCGSNRESLINRYFEHRQAFLKPNMYKSNLASHATNTTHLFPNTENIKLIKSVPKSEKWTLWKIYTSTKTIKTID